MAKYFVDEALCQAHGQCYALAPELFSADEDGYNKDAGKGWVEIPPERLAEARAAEDVCPETAIRVIEDD
jgi:ferredoxin